MLAAVPSAQAGELPCPALDSLLVEAQSNFTDRDAAEATPTLPEATDCGVARSLSGGTAYYCVWEFPYRAEQAVAAFEAFDGSIGACLVDRAVPATDTPVNHPDFYDLRLYRLDGATVSVSVKDKSALQRTFVFVRIQSEPPG